MATVRTKFPCQVRVIRNAWIPLQDGTRLAARIWLPEDAEANPVPAILEYIPYRKGDVYAEGDARRHGYVAGHGYACVRVDLRGSGDSDGLLADEYLPQEQKDGCEVIAWLASQPWCSGKVGMIGLSWGGFNALQVASHAPPALKAIVSIGSTDDRYADDIHYIGGCLFARYQLFWATTMLAYNARPADPKGVGDRWRAMWLDRLENISPFIEPWMTHQRYDDYWKQGSVCEDYDAMRCAIYMVGAWNDGYTNSVFRVLENYKGPCKGIIGPWGHQNPNVGAPGPAIGFLQEAIRWWDHWLKGIDTGMMKEPKLRTYLQDAAPPAASYPVRQGRWVGDSSWPSPQVTSRRFKLGRGTLDEHRAETAVLEHHANLVPGSDAGNWAGWGHVCDSPTDQRPDDGQWLTFDSDPLPESLDILGQATLRLRVAVDRPQALVAARLCDVGSDGRSTLITRGLFNLTHRNSRESPEALVPGAWYDVSFLLKGIGYAIPAGHRLRLAISTSYWPWAWPSPAPVVLKVSAGEACALELPSRRRLGAEPPVPNYFANPEYGPGDGAEILRQPSGGRWNRHDVGTGLNSIIDDSVFFPSVRHPNNEGIIYREDGDDGCHIVEGDPLSARVTCRRSCALERGDWRTKVEANATMTSTADEFLVTTSIDAFEGDTRIFARTWSFRFPRDLM